ncbi:MULTISPECIES: acyltransferase family protein [Escherichia]|jgi:peptidoglycan/LPS O-acetylase OafA/YrhL|uniref:acyltransferase family protein n=1 Tax=Escherichia TaxID=561 RepID=UPI000747D34C|nr:acyltransferase [Escherichia coli]EHJ8051985.1 acyltransferase [Escherichia coli]EIV8705352.1 acyltransferase [Escherichia coli]EJD5575193.1 acyltransferase [Escherichia coli]EJT6704882.1 acyltransferase [Escherichia coli]ELY5109802.1 acyltransferase [Escherichia coli]
MNKIDGGKVLSVEGVRGLACLMVVLSHLSIIFFPYLHTGDTKIIKSSFDAVTRDLPIGFTYSGTSAVYIFFVLSGYILTSVIFRSGCISKKSAKMLLERYVRLLIPVSASIIICAIVVNYFPFNKYWVPWIWSLGKDGDLSVIGVLKNSLYGSILKGDSSINMVTWTMQVEFYGSLLVFLISPISIFIKKAPLILSLIAVLIIINFNDKNAYGYASFLFGMAICLCGSYKNKVIGYAILIASLYLAGFKYNHYLYAWLKEFSLSINSIEKINLYLLFNLLSGIGVVYSLCKIGVMSWFSESKIMVFLGKLSFSAYLIQMPVFYCLSGPVYHESRKIMSDSSACLSAVLISVVMLYACSYIFYLLIDRKSIEVSHRFAAIFSK